MGLSLNYLQQFSAWGSLIFFENPTWKNKCFFFLNPNNSAMICNLQIIDISLYVCNAGKYFSFKSNWGLNEPELDLGMKSQSISVGLQLISCSTDSAQHYRSTAASICNFKASN